MNDYFDTEDALIARAKKHKALFVEKELAKNPINLGIVFSCGFLVISVMLYIALFDFLKFYGLPLLVGVVVCIIAIIKEDRRRAGDKFDEWYPEAAKLIRKRDKKDK